MNVDAGRSPLSEPSVELAARRTGMSFQRTRLSADRTLLSVIRTALSLISFGFTLFQVFQRVLASRAAADHAPRDFGLALVALGVVMLMMGMAYHVRFMAGLREERRQLARQGLVHAESVFPLSMAFVTAALLWLIGVLAISSMALSLS